MIKEIIICILSGYIIGCINPAYIISKIKGFDIRNMGSGNAGGSNALVIMGKAIGIGCIIIDILKTFAVVKICCAVFPEFIYAYPLTVTACILGHIFPFYMKFKGGKGLACIGGALLAISPLVFLAGLILGALIAVISNYICFAPIVAAIIFPAIYGVVTGNLISAIILYTASVVILFKHIENIRRIREGTEVHFDYLWKH